MAEEKFVAYYRLSTEKQGRRSGLGHEAQMEAVERCLNGGKWRLVGEVVESAKRNDRPKLADALRLGRLQNATLVIAMLDCLARNVAFISNPGRMRELLRRL